MDQHWMSMEMTAGSLTEQIGSHNTSGTSAEPNSTPVPMLMTARGAWTLMFHGLGFLSDIQQTSPRAHDQLFSVNWFMPMAQRRLGRGTLTLRAMLSLEPATITGRYYPLLFQQGETAYGNPLVDGQHPHNFFMELAALYDMKLGGNTLLRPLVDYINRRPIKAEETVWTRVAPMNRKSPTAIDAGIFPLDKGLRRKNEFSTAAKPRAAVTK